MSFGRILLISIGVGLAGAAFAWFGVELLQNMLLSWRKNRLKRNLVAQAAAIGKRAVEGTELKAEESAEKTAKSE